MTLRNCYADMHIHIGRTEAGRPVKISGSRDLTFYKIAQEASERKGIELIGIIDCHAPGVQHDIRTCIEQGEMVPVAGGGLRYRNTTILLGSEIEVRDPDCGPAHLLVFLPDLPTMQDFTRWMAGHMKNVELSSQRIYVASRVLQQEVADRGGVVIPAHIFTPHRSIYGSGAHRMDVFLDKSLITAVELGLSADTTMAGYLSELDAFPYLTNSDAHSLGKIAREYNELRIAEPSFDEFVKALRGEDGRGIIANYGMDPRLGKYHRTYCAKCHTASNTKESVTDVCTNCGSKKLVNGVMDRILSIADREQPLILPSRPPYYHQVPLEFIPGIGRKVMAKLLDHFGTEMAIIHRVPLQHLSDVAGEKIATLIGQARKGEVKLHSGSGGTYGKIEISYERKGHS